MFDLVIVNTGLPVFVVTGGEFSLELLAVNVPKLTTWAGAPGSICIWNCRSGVTMTLFDDAVDQVSVPLLALALNVTLPGIEPTAVMVQVQLKSASPMAGIVAVDGVAAPHEAFAPLVPLIVTLLGATLVIGEPPSL